MPIEQNPPQLPYTDILSEPLKTSEMSITDSYALEVVNQTYWAFELYRTQNHDRRWSTHDSLYFGYTPPRVWDGSNVARSAFTQPIVFDQVESALPAITNSLFGVAPDWFQVVAEPGTQPQEAKQLQDSMSYILEHPKDEVGSTSINEFKMAIRSLLLYGNGGVGVEWDGTLQRPVVSWVDIRDFYIDPGLMTPSVDESRCVIRRKFLTIQEILDLKKDPRMSIPNNDILWYMAKNVPQAPAEQTKRIQEALRNIYFSPGFSDYLPFPADHKVEVLIYYSKSRIIWVLNKEWVAYNGPNPYGFIPFCFAPCYTVPGRFYAQSIADVQENNQRYTEALLNAHLDELTLMLHPPRVQKRSTLLTPNQQRWRPGAVFSAEKKDDISLLQVGSNTTNVFDDVQYLAATAEKRTGINALGQGSVPTPSNANRTLGGLQMQAGGSTTRLSEIVSNIENYLLVPTLYKLFKLMQFHTKPGQVMPAASGEGDRYFVDASLAQRKIGFRMLAASKMVTRDKLMQIMPFWMQTLSQGNLMSELTKTGKTIDFDELFRMIQDATGVSHLYNLVRPLTPQEQQANQQEQQQAQQAQMQQKQQDSQTRMQIMQMKVQGDLQKEQIKKQPNPWDMQVAQQQAAMDSAAKQQELQQSAAESAMDMQNKRVMAIIDQHAKQQMAKMDLQKKAAELQLEALKAEHNRQSMVMDHQLNMQKSVSQMQMDRANAANQQDISEKFPASQQQPQGNDNKNPNRPLTTRGSVKHKSKAPNENG